MKKKYSPTQLCGYKAEKIACEFLKKQGLKLITRNFRTSFGELDLIMQNEKTLVFVEVRYRKFNSYMDVAESIDRIKQKRIIKTAMAYLQKNPTWKECRFDVITLQSNSNKEIDWIIDAFRVQ